MSYITSVTSKGQATIPIQIRKKMGIKAGDKVQFKPTNKGVELEAVPDFFSLQGSLKTDKPFDIEAMDEAVGKYLAREYAKKLKRSA